MAEKPARPGEAREVVYDERRWSLLRALRAEALRVMEALWRRRVSSIVHGSIARGDVDERSDIDVFVPTPPAPMLIELALEEAGFSASRRLIVQATPSYALKGYIELGERLCVSFPLCRLRPVEREFYRFGGELDLQGLKQGRRVRGVDKRLMLIEPTEWGHVETSIIGREQKVAKLLGVSPETVMNRVRALLRRDEVGRTGVYLKLELAPEQSFGEVLKELADRDPAVRKRLKI